MTEDKFLFKEFGIAQARSSMKVNTDGIILGAWAPLIGKGRILDIGCGNGLISLMMAQREPQCHIVGVEIDEGSYLDALDNANASDFADRVTIIHGAIQEFTRQSEQVFDHIISNPPFFSGGTFSSNEGKKLVRHTVKLSHGDLLQSVNRVIAKDGLFSLILPQMEGLRFVELATRAGFYLKLKCEVYSKPGNIERLLMTFAKSEVETEVSSFMIYGGDSKYTEEFKELTKAFYLNLAN